MYVRRVRAGEFMVINNHLVNDLCALGLWNQEVRWMLKCCLSATGLLCNVSFILLDECEIRFGIELLGMGVPFRILKSFLIRSKCCIRQCGK